ncbi:hypothetical protein [Kocuria sp.]|uniref:hypothetical protein n=1 Tax=Kocuria sp. TaxID=1871328 RepID=UPI0026DEB50E|nr:hypothetical protein [Kocuria sp.]MDO5618669.1 hypothetical protein [Kocuria sp.]
MTLHPGRSVASGGRALAVAATLVLPTILVGCGQEDGTSSTTNDIPAPPDRTDSQFVAQGVDLPTWAYSGACDQPRPNADDDGLVRPDPIAAEQNVPVYVPGVEEVLCKINGVEAASVIGTYSETDAGRSGTADVGVLMASDSTEENIRSVRQAAVTAADQQGLGAQGLELQKITIYLTDGSHVTGPSQGQVQDGSITLTGAGIQILDQLRAAGQGERWSVEVGNELVVTTFLDGNPADSAMSGQVQSALQASTEIQTPVTNLVRKDRVVVEHQNLTLTYTDGQQQLVTGALVKDLQELSESSGVQTVSAEIDGDSQQNSVLRVEIQPATPGTAPEVERALDDLRQVAGLRGLQLEENVVGLPPTPTPT